MRRALDGLPRDLPLSPTERRQLRARIRAWKPPRGRGFPLWVAVIPGGVSLLMFFIWMPALWMLHSSWRYAIVAAAIIAQFWITLRLMRWATWPHTCRALAACGYEVCPRCAYPLQNATDPHCPECGARRPAPDK